MLHIKVQQLCDVQGVSYLLPLQADKLT